MTLSVSAFKVGVLDGEYWGVRCKTGSESGVGEVGVGGHKKKRGKAFDLTSL